MICWHCFCERMEIMSRPPKEPFALRLPPKMLDALRRVADAQERPVSEVVREAVQEYLAKTPPV